jgi:CTP-dependent riboflavin kinase
VPQIAKTPEIEAFGFALTVTVVVVGQPALFVKVIVVVPGETAVTKPVFEIVATAVLLDAHGVLKDGEPDDDN